jgi:hypothetical protein
MTINTSSTKVINPHERNNGSYTHVNTKSIIFLKNVKELTHQRPKESFLNNKPKEICNYQHIVMHLKQINLKYKKMR